MAESIKAVKNAISAFAGMDPSLTDRVNKVLDALDEDLEEQGYDETCAEEVDTATEELTNFVNELTENVIDEEEKTVAEVVGTVEFVEDDEEDE